jgi:hypothetical protein
MDFDRLSIAEGNRTSRLDGALAMRLDATAYPMLEYEQSGARLSVTDGTHTVLLRNWNTALSSDQSSLPTAWTLAASGAVDVLEHGGSAVYQTLQPLTGFGEERPEAGVIRIVGGAGASIVVTALSSEQARLDMDYDGDGVIDEAVVVTWLELEG